MYDFDKAGLLRKIQEAKAKRVVLQLPDGLRPHGFDMAKFLELEGGVEVIVSGDPCWGACDLALDQMKKFEADLIVHCGHAEIPPLSVPNVIYVEARAPWDISDPIKKAIVLLQEEERIGLLATVQHVQKLDEAKKILESAGKKVSIGKAAGWLKYNGQVLGCDYNSVRFVAKDVDAFVLVAGGNFHGVGVYFTSGKRTIVVDPYTKEARDITDLAKRTLRKRYASVTKFRNCNKIGILVDTKSGQFNLKTTMYLKEKLEKRGKTCIVMAVAEIRPDELSSFNDLEAFVNTACPRVAVEDEERFEKPILNPNEVMLALGEIDLEKYLHEYVG